MIKPKYQIGDVVWTGKWEPYEICEKCPDCGGTLKLTVTLFDNTIYGIPCETCKRGYEGPYGVVRRIGYHAEVQELVVHGMELGCWDSNKGIWQYKLGLEGSCYLNIPEHEIFIDEHAAMNFAISKGRQLEINGAARVLMKEKPAHTWAWHVTYHRRQVKEAQRQLEYHTKALGIAREKSKVKEG